MKKIGVVFLGSLHVVTIIIIAFLISFRSTITNDSNWFFAFHAEVYNVEEEYFRQVVVIDDLGRSLTDYITGRSVDGSFEAEDAGFKDSDYRWLNLIKERYNNSFVLLIILSSLLILTTIVHVVLWKKDIEKQCILGQKNFTFHTILISYLIVSSTTINIIGLCVFCFLLYCKKERKIHERALLYCVGSSIPVTLFNLHIIFDTGFVSSILEAFMGGKTVDLLYANESLLMRFITPASLAYMNKQVISSFSLCKSLMLLLWGIILACIYLFLWMIVARSYKAKHSAASGSQGRSDSLYHGVMP